MSRISDLSTFAVLLLVLFSACRTPHGQPQTGNLRRDENNRTFDDLGPPLPKVGEEIAQRGPEAAYGSAGTGSPAVLFGGSYVVLPAGMSNGVLANCKPE